MALKNSGEKKFLKQKVSGNKVLPETLFSWTFFLVPVWFYFKNSRKKSSLTFHGNEGCLQTCKKGACNYKHPWLHSISKWIEEKSFLWNRLRLDLIFPRLRTFFLVFSFFRYIYFWTLIPLILFHETLLAAPILSKKKFPRI